MQASWNVESEYSKKKTIHADTKLSIIIGCLVSQQKIYRKFKIRAIISRNSKWWFKWFSYLRNLKRSIHLYVSIAFKNGVWRCSIVFHINVAVLHFPEVQTPIIYASLTKSCAKTVLWCEQETFSRFHIKLLIYLQKKISSNPKLILVNVANDKQC